MYPNQYQIDQYDAAERQAKARRKNYPQQEHEKSQAKDAGKCR